MAKKDDKFFTQSVDVSIPSQNIELDPRSVTTADGMQRNYIPTGDETEVRGTKRMLKDKKRKQLSGISMWFSALKLGRKRRQRTSIRRNKKTKMKMADAQLMHADKMARGRERVPGQIIRSPTIGLERRVRFARVNGANFGDRLGSLQR